ncbi:MAG: YkuS family protein [Sporomusaceae bacterium]|nr:YkuS family protein [Sporomusaceae bacterium]
MQGIIGLEKELDRLSPVLETEGYEVVVFDVKMPEQDIDALVVSGLESPDLYTTEELVDVPIINASGKTTEEILAELEKL